MIDFIRGYTIENIKRKLILLYCLNVSDIIFTLILLKTGMFKEGNIIMKDIVNNQFLSIMIKAGLILLLLVILYKRMKRANIMQLKISNYIINSANILYLVINIFHIIWSIIAIYILY